MKSYKKIYIGIVCIISLSYIGNLIYYYNNRLDKPCFLQHYYDLKQGEMCRLYFVDNKVTNEKDKITNIGIGDYNFTINNQYNQCCNYNNPGTLQLRAIEINPNDSEHLRNPMQDEILGSYKEITVHYGERIEKVPIGNISFKERPIKSTKEEILLEQSRHFNEEKYQVMFFASKAMKILEVKDKYNQDNIEVFSEYPPSGSNSITKKSLPFYVESGERVIIKGDSSKLMEKASKEGLAFSYHLEVVYQSMDGDKGIKSLNVTVVPKDYNIDIKSMKESLKSRRGEL